MYSCLGAYSPYATFTLVEEHFPFFLQFKIYINLVDWFFPSAIAKLQRNPKEKTTEHLMTATYGRNVSWKTIWRRLMVVNVRAREQAV